MIDVKVSGNSVDYTNCSISDRLNDASTASFNFYDPDETNNYPQGTPVQIYDDDGLQFSGFVDKCKTVRKGQGVHTVNCVDNHYLAKKRTYNKKWISVKAGDVVRDMVNTVLKYEGVRGFNLVKEYNSAVSWNTGTTVGATPSDSGITLAKTGTDKSVTYSSTGEFDSGTKSNLDSSTNQIVLTKEGSMFTKVWTLLADWDSGTKTNVIGTSDQLQLTYAGSQVVDTDNTGGTLGTGTLASTTAAYGDLRLACTYYDSGDTISGWGTSGWSSNGGALYTGAGSGNYCARSIGTAPNTNLEYDAYVPSGGIIDFCFMCNSNADGQFFRLDSRSTYKCGYYYMTGGSWSSGWTFTNQAYEGFQQSGNAWHHVRLAFGATTVQAYVDGTAAGAAFPFENNGGYVNIISEVVSGAYVDNITLYPNYGYRVFTVPLSAVGVASSSSISWTISAAPTGSWCSVYTSFDNSSWVLQSASGGAVNGVNGVNMSGKTLYVLMQLGSSYANTPAFSYVNVTVNPVYNTSGSWQSSPQSVAAPVYAKSSSLAWNWNIPASCSITMKTSINGGTSWETIATSGNAIGNVTLRTPLTGVNLLVRAEFVGTTTATPLLYDVTATIDTSYKLSGTWTSPAITLDQLVKYMSGTMSWNAASLPANTTITMYASTNGTDFTQVATSGGNLPNYALLDDMAGKSVWIRATLGTNGTNTPTVYDVTASTVSAYNTVATWNTVFDISDVGAPGATSITYTVNAPTNSTVLIETSLDNTSWSSSASSGSSIPVINDMDYVVGLNLYVRITITSNGAVQPSISYLKVELDNGTIKDGLTLNEVAFGRTNCNTGIQLLANRCSFWWCIDAARVLWFCDRNLLWADPDTFSVLDMTQPFNSEIGNAQYRNKQYIKGGNETTELQTQALKADGTTKAWPLAYNIKNITDITVGGVSVGSSNIGSKGDSGKKWYYTEGDPILMHGEATAIANGTAIVVTYYGTFPMVVQSQDDAEIATRKAIEGVGTGIVENVIDDSSMTSSTSGLQYANNLLATYANMGTTFSFPSWNNYAAGTLIKADMADYGYDMTQMLIVQVDKKQSGDEFLKTVTVTQNTNIEHWSDIFKSFDKSLIIRDNVKENEILVQSTTISETWGAWSETVSDVPTTAPKVSETTYPAENIYPS